MVVSPYRTKLTRMIQTGERNPERDTANRKASEQPLRHALWLARKAKAKAA